MKDLSVKILLPLFSVFFYFLFWASHVAAAPIQIEGKSYIRSGVTETINVDFSAPNTATTIEYSGFVEIEISGVGQSNGTNYNDAFYGFDDLNPANFYSFADLVHLAVDSDNLPADLAGTKLATVTNLIAFDSSINCGSAVTTLPYFPAYQLDHSYNFVIDVTDTQSFVGAASLLHLAVIDGGYLDNTGAYNVTLYQLEETEVEEAPVGSLIVGNELCDRPLDSTYNAGDLVFDTEQAFFTTDGQVSDWAFFDNDDFEPGRLITPVILRINEGSTTIVGIGATRTTTESGLQSYPFDLANGSDLVYGDGSYVFAIRHGNADGSVINFGVADISPSGTSNFFAIGNLGIEAGNDLPTSSTFQATYSYNATVQVIPPLSVKNPVTNLSFDEDISQGFVDFENVFGSLLGVTVTFENTAPLVVDANVEEGATGLRVYNSANQHGSAQITLRATNSVTTVVESFTVDIVSINDAPIVPENTLENLGIGQGLKTGKSILIGRDKLGEGINGAGEYGGALFFDVDQEAINYEGLDELTVTAVSSDSGVVSVSRGVGGELILTGVGPGTAEIVLNAMDTFNETATRSFSVDVFGEIQLQQVIKDPENGTFFAAAISGRAGETMQSLELLTSDRCENGQLIDPVIVNSYDIGTGDTIGFDANGKALVVGLIGNGETETGAVVSTYLSARIAGMAAASDMTTCMVTGSDNDSWVRATSLDFNYDEASTTGFVDRKGNARWYKFFMPPGAKAKIDLSNLPKDYDLYVFKDINKAFKELVGNKDVKGLNVLSAEFAPSVFSPSVFSPSVFSPSVFSPDAYAPSVFSPSVFSPSVFSPSVFSPSVFSPSVFSPSVFSPSVFSPSVFSPSVFSPSVFSPSVFSPSVFSSANFASAQMRSIIGLAAQEGIGSESVSAHSWNSPGEYYVRVSGKNGVFDIETPFALNVVMDTLNCSNVGQIGSPPSSIAGDYETVILWDRARIAAENSPVDLGVLEERLGQLAVRVGGVLIDLSQNTRVQALHVQADESPNCPYAENLAAQAIKDVIDAHRSGGNNMKYVVLVGSDGHIPFFRYPDTVGLGPEQNYDPSLADGTQSQSALRLNYLLGQDEYGAADTLELIDGKFPLPDLAVGRLVESAAEIITMIDAYLDDTKDGVIDDPTSTLVTGYDFLTDVAEAVEAELQVGTSGARHDTLITDSKLSPDDPLSWTATDLQRELLEDGEDIIFLAGHFSAVSALAADYKTQAMSTDLLQTDADYTNSIVFSAGCHSGYNIVDGDVVPGVDVPSDWAQIFARKGATLVAGTGYQYGDTDFIYYSERLYLQFARELRYGAIGDPVSVGEALVRAKQHYLATTPEMTGLHRKSMLISTLFGLPMLSVDLKGERTGYPGGNQTAECQANVLEDAVGVPGSTLGLKTCALNIAENLLPHEVNLTGLSTSDTVATYLEGPAGVVTNPGQPALPLVARTVSTDLALRGIGLRGGVWTESAVVPLTGAPTTELRGVHTSFSSPVNFPMRLATANYYGALAGDGDTTLFVTPAQHRADPDDPQFIGSILRQFSSMDFVLYYSDNTESYEIDGDTSRSNQPALAGPPTMSGVIALQDGNNIVFMTNVVGDPAAGIESVWVTYTDGSQSQGEWQSINLEQDEENTTLWKVVIPNPGYVRLDYMLQAVNGVGLVTMDDRSGAYYQLAGDLQDLDADGELPPAVHNESQVDFITSTLYGTYGETIEVGAKLATVQGPIEGVRVTFSIGNTARNAITDSSGEAFVSIPLNSSPGNYLLTASFAGDELVAAAKAEEAFTIEKSGTQLTFFAGEQSVGIEGVESGLLVALTDDDLVEYDDAGLPGGTLRERTVYFTISGGPAEVLLTLPVITDNVGRANLRELALPAGSYTVEAQFMGTIPFGMDVDGTSLYRVLSDDFYQASSATFALELEGSEACPTSQFGKIKESDKSKKDKKEDDKKGSDKKGDDKKGDDKKGDDKKGDDKKGDDKKGDDNDDENSNDGVLELDGFCYLSHDVGANIDIRNGTLIVGNGVLASNKIVQKGPGSVHVLKTAFVGNKIDENDAGNIVINGIVDGKLKEKGAGNIIIGIGASVDGNVDEYDSGSIIVNGSVDGNVEERSNGDLIIGTTGTIDGHARESGKGSLSNDGVVSKDTESSDHHDD